MCRVVKGVFCFQKTFHADPPSYYLFTLFIVGFRQPKSPMETFMTSVPFSPARGMAARLIVFGMGAMLAVAFAGATGAQTAPKVTRIDPPKSVLFVGNSYMYYNNSLHNHVVRLAHEADKANAEDYFFRSMTLSGAYLHEHEGTLPGIINSRKWDVIVLQGQSRRPTRFMGALWWKKRSRWLPRINLETSVGRV